MSGIFIARKSSLVSQPGVATGRIRDVGRGAFLTTPEAACTCAPAPVVSAPPPPPPPPPPSPLRPKFFVAPANAHVVGTQAFLDGATFLSGSSANGKAGSFTLQTTPGNYGWLAVNAAASASGIAVSDGLGLGGWSGAGRPGNYSAGDTIDTSTVTVTDATTGATLRLFRQDYVNANPTPAAYTTS